MLKGRENIYYNNIAPLQISVPYNQEKDIMFYSDKVAGEKVTLDGTNFMMIFPHEGHAPQAACNSCEQVIKVVIKIPYLFI